MPLNSVTPIMATPTRDIFPVAKLIFTQRELSLGEDELARATAAWLQTHDEAKLWTLHLQFLRVARVLDTVTETKVWSKAMQIYFEEK